MIIRYALNYIQIMHHRKHAVLINGGSTWDAKVMNTCMQNAVFLTKRFKLNIPKAVGIFKVSFFNFWTEKYTYLPNVFSVK